MAPGSTSPRRPDIELTDVTIGYPSIDGETPQSVCSRISLTVEYGEIVALLGPSGCGKTSLLRAVARVLQPSAGSIFLNSERSRNGVGWLQQQTSLLPWRTVAANAAYGLEAQRSLTPDDCEGIAQLLFEFGMLHDADKLPQQLSGGMKQRTAVIRAFAARHNILLCDEPFASIDHVRRLELGYLFRKTCATNKMSALFVTHSIEEAIFISDRIYVMGAMRPSVIVDIIDNNQIFESPEDAMECRRSSEFHTLLERIWDGLAKR